MEFVGHVPVMHLPSAWDCDFLSPVDYLISARKNKLSLSARVSYIDTSSPGVKRASKSRVRV